MELSEVVTQKQLAALLGLSEGRVSQLIGDDTIPPPSAGLAAQVQGYCLGLRDAASGRAEPLGLVTERARLTKAQADKAELELAELERELIRMDAVRTVAASAFATTREAFLQLPPRLASVLASEASAARVHDLLQAEIHQALEQLASLPERISA